MVCAVAGRIDAGGQRLGNVRDVAVHSGYRPVPGGRKQVHVLHSLSFKGHDISWAATIVGIVPSSLIPVFFGKGDTGHVDAPS